MSPGFSLLLIDKLQRSPRHIPRDVARSIRGFEVCRLHKRVNIGYLIHTLLLCNSHTIAPLWGYHAGSGIHLFLQLSALARTTCHLRRGIAAILTPLGME